MPIQLTTAKQANTSKDVTGKVGATISARVVSAEQTHDGAAETFSQQRTALTSSQIHALVCSAFDSASTRLHTPSEEGMQTRFLMALCYFCCSSHHFVFLLFFFLFSIFLFFFLFFISLFIFTLLPISLQFHTTSLRFFPSYRRLAKCCIGTTEAIIPSQADTVIKGSEPGPQSPRLVDIKTHDAGRANAQKKHLIVSEPHTGEDYSLVFIPGVGFRNQKHGAELGS